jgi:hypothetical protein
VSLLSSPLSRVLSLASSLPHASSPPHTSSISGVIVLSRVLTHFLVLFPDLSFSLSYRHTLPLLPAQGRTTSTRRATYFRPQISPFPRSSDFLNAPQGEHTFFFRPVPGCLFSHLYQSLWETQQFLLHLTVCSVLPDPVRYKHAVFAFPALPPPSS